MPDSPSSTHSILTSSPDETRLLAGRLGRIAAGGELILLFGDLGAGKTTFVQGLADGLGISVPVTSPTFTLIHEYRAGEGSRLPLFHFDLYRLDNSGDVLDLGFFDYLGQDCVVVVEWPERLDDSLPDDRLEIHFRVQGETFRELDIAAFGSAHVRLLRELEAGR